uniref:Phosphate ABC transporter periplasmic phosphate-binding protein PstS n=1 Tax=uncultured bacterium F25-01 TaxID=1191433 RepID=I3VIG3_9BACT|nr:phosphate ABC transporter periplasmic phosphate-binding protein PstS [uncultured bacterium F25-01]
METPDVKRTTSAGEIPNPGRTVASRRRFLFGTVGVTGAAILVACGGQAASPTAAPAPAQPIAPIVPTATAASAAAASTAPTATAAAAAAPAPTPLVFPTAAPGELLINGAGSSFDNPLFSKAFSEYNKANPKIKINYGSVGSGAGIQQFTKGTVDFGASDAPMTDQQITDSGGDAIHLPVTLGPAAVSYNLPGIAEGVKLTGVVLGDIFMGKITAWNDPAIVKLNPDVKLDNTPIAVVHRSDGSGTTDIFTSYLTSISPDWKTNVGFGSSVKWPVGIGGKGSEGVAGQVKQTPGGIGYFELAYAQANKLTSAAIDDGSGNYLLPGPDGASACAANVASKVPSDLRIRIAGCGGGVKGAYPISGFSWVILHKTQKDTEHGQALANLFWWMIHSGQSFAKDLNYAPLPDAIVKLGEEKLKGIVTADGKLALTVST